MEITTKTPVEVIQELIAIHTTRKDAVEKLTAKKPPNAEVAKLRSAAQQSDEFIAELMNELSNYGDAVMANVDRENEYQEIWKRSLGTIDSISPMEGEQTFQAMESALKKMYEHTLEANSDLPVSVAEILNRQLSKL
jgi:hypothetical protein